MAVNMSTGLAMPSVARSIGIEKTEKIPPVRSFPFERLPVELWELVLFNVLVRRHSHRTIPSAADGPLVRAEGWAGEPACC